MKQSIKSKIKRAAMYLLGFSATPMLTACYGMPIDYESDDSTPFEDIGGVVLDMKSGKPIPGISITTYDMSASAITDSEGKFFIDRYFVTSQTLNAEDIDGAANGKYLDHNAVANSQNHLDITIHLYPIE